MAKKLARKGANTRRIPARKPAAGGKAAEARAAKPTKRCEKREAGKASTCDTLSKPEIKKIQELIKSKSPDDITQAMVILGGSGKIAAEHDGLFTEAIKKKLARMANTWLHDNSESRRWFRVYQSVVVRPAFLKTWQCTRRAKKPFIDLVSVAAGAFTMGSSEAVRKAMQLLGKPRYRDDEKSVSVCITKPFAISRTVVTQGQWRAVMGTEPWRNQRQGAFGGASHDKIPAIYVSWDDAVLFCQTLTELERETGRLQTTQSYRLPTEAEWEYACRAGTSTTYSFGDEPAGLGQYAWYRANSGLKVHAVAQREPNPWGLFDMNGNVCEWCVDLYDEALAGGSNPAGPAERLSQSMRGDRRRHRAIYRVHRGGHWGSDVSCCRSGSRGFDAPDCRDDFKGFRVVLAE